MTAADLAQVLRNDAGIVQAGDGGAQFEAAILQSLVKTLVEIYSRAPNTWISERTRGEVIHAPTTVQVTVAQNAKTITFVSGYQSWMNECTVLIAGDSTQNQLVKDGSATTSLANPYLGPSGTVSAVVYHDSVILGSDTFRVGSPVMLDQRWELSAMDTPRDLQKAQPGIFQGVGPYYGTGYDYSGYQNLGFSADLLRTTDKRITTPYAFRVGRVYGYDVAQSCRMVLSALPERQYTLKYPAQVIPMITDLSDTTVPEYLPFSNDETILVPWARWNFCTNPQVTLSQATLKPAFDAATAMLRSLTPQPSVMQQISYGGW